MPYKVKTFNQENGFNLRPKVAQNSFANKSSHQEEGRSLIAAKAAKLESDPLAFNGEKALFYFKDEDSVLKIVAEDYASVLAASEVNRNQAVVEEAKEKGQFLRSHFAAGVIAVCHTADDKIIIGSRDVNKDKVDPTKYPIQFPCGFIDVTEDFYNKMKEGKPDLLREAIISDAKRELREELLNFDDSQISQSPQLLAVIYETKKWPVKEEKGGGTKDVNVIKSFVIQINVNLTYLEIEERRAATIEKLQADLRTDPANKDLLQQEKDFNEMTKIGCIDLAQLPEILAGKTDSTKVEIHFDNKPRQFAAEHGMTLDAVLQHLETKLPTSVITAESRNASAIIAPLSATAMLTTHDLNKSVR